MGFTFCLVLVYSKYLWILCNTSLSVNDTGNGTHFLFMYLLCVCTIWMCMYVCTCTHTCYLCVCVHMHTRVFIILLHIIEAQMWNVPHRLLCLNIWSSNGCATSEGCGVMEECTGNRHQQRHVLRFYRLTPLPVQLCTLTTGMTGAPSSHARSFCLVFPLPCPPHLILQ